MLDAGPDSQAIGVPVTSDNGGGNGGGRRWVILDALRRRGLEASFAFLPDWW
jgi:hypothetical protein